MSYRVTVAPVVEPVTLDEAKLWLKVDDDTDNTLIEGLIATARIWAERQTGQALLTQTIEEVWDCPQGCYDLSIGPLIAVTKVEYRDSAGAYQTWATTNYSVDEVSNPARVVPLQTLSVGRYPNAVRITYTAGVASANLVDDSILTAMKLHLRWLYDNREDMPLGKDGSPTARSAWNLLSQSRTNWL